MTSLPPLRLGFWQDETPKGGVTACLDLVETALRQARSDGVDLLVFPECFLTGYYRDAAKVSAVAQEVRDAHLGRLSAMADAFDIGFALGAYEATPKGIANAAHVFLPGEPRRTYHKRALYGDWEKAAFQRGQRPLRFRFRGRAFGVLICFDVEFPELVRELALDGADVILVPTALMDPEHDVADFLVQARAIENNVTIVYANRIGQEGDLTYIGQSQICGPRAECRVMADAHFIGLMAGEAHASIGLNDYLVERRLIMPP